MLKKSTVMLHFVMMSKKFLLHSGLDWNLMKNCKHKDIQKILVIVGRFWIIFWMIYRKKNNKTNWLNASWRINLRNKHSECIDHIKKTDRIKIASVARSLNSNTNQFSVSSPLEPLAKQLARANKNINLQLILITRTHMLY